MVAVAFAFHTILYIALVVAVSGALLVFLLRGCFTLILKIIVFRQERSYARAITIPYEQHFVKSKAGDSIDLWWVPHPTSTEVLLYLHGNSGRLPHFFESFCEQYNVLSPSYPGYGLSEGKPTEDNVYETAELAYQWLLDKKYEENQIIIWGHSLGGAPAVYLASKHPGCKKLIVVNSFSSLKSLCKRKYGFFLAPFLKNWFDTSKYAKQVEGKVVQFCYKNDKTVPFEECKLLFDNYKTTNKKLVVMQGHCHEYFQIEYTAVDNI